MPAEVTGTVLLRLHSAAASCERAELWVQTNTTRVAGTANAPRTMAPTASEDSRT